MPSLARGAGCDELLAAVRIQTATAGVPGIASCKFASLSDETKLHETICCYVQLKKLG